MGWVVNATAHPLYPAEMTLNQSIGGWVGHKAGLDGCGKLDFPSAQKFQDRFEAFFMSCLRDYWGTRWRSWLRHRATIWRVAGSTPDEVTDSKLPAEIWLWG
jgi:hypothetical protein